MKSRESALLAKRSIESMSSFFPSIECLEGSLVGGASARNVWQWRKTVGLYFENCYKSPKAEEQEWEARKKTKSFMEEKNNEGIQRKNIVPWLMPLQPPRRCYLHRMPRYSPTPLPFESRVLFCREQQNAEQILSSNGNVLVSRDSHIVRGSGG